MNKTYIDENGKERVYRLADYLDDTDPHWRLRLPNHVIDRILAGGHMSYHEAEEYLVDYYGD